MLIINKIMDGQSQDSLLDRDYDQEELSFSSLNLINRQNTYNSFLSEGNSINNRNDTYNISNLQTGNEVRNVFYPNDIKEINDEPSEDDKRFYIVKKEKKEKKEEKNIKRNKKAIFYIFKKDGIRGRRSNAYKEKHKFVKYEHSKIRDDNVIRKVKTHFTNDILEYVNIIYGNEYQKLHKNSPKTHWLQKISRQSKTFIRKDENLKWLNMKLKDYLSSQVSTKNKHFEIGHNAKEIKKVLDEGKMGELINILNTDIGTLLKQYATKEEIVQYDGVSFPCLEEKFKEENAKDDEEKEYIQKVKRIAVNFWSIFNDKSDRKK